MQPSPYNPDSSMDAPPPAYGLNVGLSGQAPPTDSAPPTNGEVQLTPSYLVNPGYSVPAPSADSSYPAQHPQQPIAGFPKQGSAPCPAPLGTVYMQPAIAVSPATIAVGRMLSKATMCIVFGLFLCFPGIVLTAMGNSDHMSIFSSDAKWMKTLGPILLAVGILLLLCGIVRYRKVKSSYPEECKTLGVLSFMQQRNNMMYAGQATFIQQPQQVNTVQYPPQSQGIAPPSYQQA